MKQKNGPLIVLMVIGINIAIISFLLVLQSFRTIPPPPKTYTVTLNLDEWRGVLQAIDTSSKLLNKSDLPVREVIFANQSLAQVNQAIQFQVGQQLQAEAKKDSTNAVKPKK